MVVHFVDVDFSQFYIRNETDSDVDVEHDFGGTGLATYFDPGMVMATCFQQNGPIPIDIEVLHTQPTPLPPAWQDVVEISFVANARTTLSGWEERSSDLPLDVTPGHSYRLRFAVADADLARERLDWEGPVPERYQVRLWPAPPAPSAILRCDSGIGQYWLFQKAADLAYERVRHLPCEEQARAIIDIGLLEHPETAKQIACGDHAFRSGISAYVKKVQCTNTDWKQLAALIDERAQILTRNA